MRLIAEYKDISDYEDKSAKDLIKAFRGSRPRLGIKKNKLKEIKKDFYNLRHNFYKKDADKCRKLFYDIKNYRHLSELEIEEADDDKYRKIGSVRRLSVESNGDYYKPKVIDRGFAREVNNYIKYTS